MSKLSIKNQIKVAPKYGLFIEGAGWLAEGQGLSGIVFTEHKELARRFAEGFDDPTQKCGIWSAVAQRLFNNPDISFEPVYL